MEFVLIALILVVVVVFVAAPLRRTRAKGGVEDPRIADLEARKEAKYREIRDAEMDREAGKLSSEDWRRQDTELRREAIRILRELDELEAGRGR